MDGVPSPGAGSSGSTHQYKIAAAVHRALNALYDLAVELAEDPQFGEQAARELRAQADEMQRRYSPFGEGDAEQH